MEPSSSDGAAVTELLLPERDSYGAVNSGIHLAAGEERASHSRPGESVAPRRASWAYIFAVCSLGFFVNCQPSEPYLTIYLEDVKNITDQNLEQYVWPADTYSTFVALPLVGVLAEVFGYRAVIAGGLACREVTRLLLIFGQGVGFMVATQVTYAAATSVNVIYFAYVYTVFEKVDYQRATACIHAAYHFGNALGSGAGQLLVTYAHWPLLHLFYFSFAMTTVGALCFVFVLPKPRHPAPPSLARMFMEDGPRLAWRQLRDLYNARVLQWTLWWLLGFSMQQIISNYYAIQFTERDKNGAYGLVELAMELGASVGSLAPSGLRGALAPFTSTILVTTSAAKGAMWFLTTVITTATASYSLNVAAFTINAFQEAAGSAIIASTLKHSRYAIVFTANAFFAFAISSVVVAVGTAVGLETDGYYRLTAIVQFAFVGIYIPATWCLLRRESRRHKGSDAGVHRLLEPSEASGGRGFRSADGSL